MDKGSIITALHEVASIVQLRRRWVSDSVVADAVSQHLQSTASTDLKSVTTQLLNQAVSKDSTLHSIDTSLQENTSGYFR